METSQSKMNKTIVVPCQGIVFGICNKNFTQFRKLRIMDKVVINAMIVGPDQALNIKTET